MIEGVMKHVASAHGKNIEAILLEPQYDATTGKHDKFGYTQIRAWCKKASYLQQTQGRDWIGQQLALSNADLLLIHMDTDIAQNLELNNSLFSGDFKSRKSWCNESLNAWLGLAKGGDCYYVLPTWQIESWILATYDEVNSPKVFPSAVADYESIQDVETRLLSLGYKEDLQKNGRIYKERSLYSKDPNYLQRLQNNFSIAAERCDELHDFQVLLTKVINKDSHLCENDI
ncbi:MAG: hypothetical protein COA61_005085 [Zetaproteobacteria bacterium]|nr:hypothetical protein [Zetaproteobacteria bacterium]